jgi:S-DNA-T family DNA segregation ATPase FtsK/SpoIIIE
MADSGKIRREVTGLLAFAAALFLAVTFYLPGLWTGAVGRAIRLVFFGLFGTPALSLPVIFLLFSVDAFLEKTSRYRRYRGIGLLLLLVFASALVSVFSTSAQELVFAAKANGVSTSFGLICFSWQRGIAPQTIAAGNVWSGGLTGDLFGLSLSRLFGKAGSLILLITLLLVLIVIVWRVSLSHLFVRSIRAVGRAPGRVGAKIGSGFDKIAEKTDRPISPPTKPVPIPDSWFEPGEVPIVDLYTDLEPKQNIRPAEPVFPHVLQQQEDKAQDVKAPEKKTKRRTTKKDVASNQLSFFSSWRPPPLSLLTPDEKSGVGEQKMKHIQQQARLLEEVLATFKIDAKVANFQTGPTITRYELTLAPGIKVSRIVNLADDIALNLAALGVRIEAPIPGTPYIGIEIPNRETRPVRLRGLLEADEFQTAKGPLVAALGRDAAGKVILCDIETMPHLLIAGATGSGKSVCINTILISLLYRMGPEDLRILLIDPKVVELKAYNGIPHLLQPVVTNPKKAFGVLNWAVMEMDRRYNLIAERNVREINAYNEAARHFKDDDFEYLPHILIVIDELADLMYTTATEVEDAISRLMAKARAAGIHLIIATQRPSVDVITGVIKSNIPSRIAFAVSSQIDSRVILDSGGAEKLLGRGDMLYAPLGAAKATRGQGALVTDGEVERVLGYIKSHNDSDYVDSVGEVIESAGQGTKGRSGESDEEDELLMEALGIFVEAGHATVSLLQRRLSVGHPRAARLVDRLEQLHYIGPSEGSKPRRLLVSRSDYEAMTADGGVPDEI